MKKIIPYGRQFISEEDIKEVVNTLKSDYLTQGPKIAEFESEFAKYVGAKYAIALSNGTAALHLSALALGLKKGDYVICTPITFAASVNCVRYCGANVLFADIDPKTFLMDLSSVEKLIKEHSDKRIVGIIPVDFAGRVVNLEALKKITSNYGFWILEDSCHAPGGYFLDEKKQVQNAGNGNFAELSIFSFHPVKHIAAGEGGMVTTNNKHLYDKICNLRTHGIIKNEQNYKNNASLANGNKNYSDFPGWYMEMQSLGFNYRITDIQAALGLSQLKRAQEGLDKRKKIAQIYTREFSRIPQIINHSNVIEGHAYHLFILEVENRRELYDYLRENNIFSQIHYIPVHLMPYYKELGWKEGDLPKAEKYYSNCISLPMYPTMTNEEIDRVIQTIKTFYKNEF